jgi:hypothetical protein
MKLLEKNPLKINWNSLSMNPSAIEMLEKNPSKINWRFLSANPNALHLLEKNQENIDWNFLSSNPSIFKKNINYKFLKERIDTIREELMMKCMDLSRLERWLENDGNIDDF